MKTKHLSDEFGVSDQLATDDIALVHAMGFKSIICNRPDGEALGQTMFELIRRVATNAGMNAECVPIEGSGPSGSDLIQMIKANGRLEKPVLA